MPGSGCLTWGASLRLVRKFGKVDISAWVVCRRKVARQPLVSRYLQDLFYDLLNNINTLIYRMIVGVIMS